MEDVLTAVLAKAYQKPAIVDVFQKRIVIIDDEFNLTTEQMALGFPLLGIRDGGQSPENIGPEQEDESADVEFHVFTQRFWNSTDSLVGPGGILSLMSLVRKAFNRDIDFSNVDYSGPYIFEAEWQSTSKSESFLNANQTPAGKHCFSVIRYRRYTELS